jgi:predicted ribosomally synthesized peptide with SipW-like signal peptide
MNKKILISLCVIGAVAAIAVGGTIAFFSDTETSTGNTFTAGAIDLSLGSSFTSASNGNSAFALDPNNNGKALYNFTDLKPGDMGGGSFNLQVTSNDAYVCAKSLITATPENVRNYPELNAGDNTYGANEGELQNYLKFATFDDDNENGVYDAGSEPINVGQYLPTPVTTGITMTVLNAAGWVSVADMASPNTWLVQPTLPTGVVQSAGLLYCFGDFKTTGTGAGIQVTGCDGSGNQNVAQTDGVVGSIEFSAVQTRNNPNFTCASMNI